jgi:hypothetical protein
MKKITNSKTTSQQENDGIGIELNGNSTVKVNAIGMDYLCDLFKRSEKHFLFSGRIWSSQ